MSPSAFPVVAPEPPSRSVRIRSLLDELVDEANAHPALHHPWLDAVANSTLPDPFGALRSFASTYHGYSCWFPRYLRAVIDRLEAPAHRELLLANLEEEKGHLGEEDRAALLAIGIDPASVDGIPHPELFRRFCRAMGVTPAELAVVHPAAQRWRTRFLAMLDGGSPAFGVGALGLGTESVVRPIYLKLLAGIRALNRLDRPDYVFFELHCEVDDQHQKDLLAVAAELATTPAGRADLALGMRSALDLRRQFWDAMLVQHGSMVA
jgi:pyrroloquinoline quinone (PQQ) biosynthesis protein C